MRVGTKSLLVGAHQFLWHPFTVWLSWRKIYGQWPDWKVCVCIFLHDIGYWGKRNMEGTGNTFLAAGDAPIDENYEDGIYHTIGGARIAQNWLDVQPILVDRGYKKKVCLRKAGTKYMFLVLFHSRTYASLYGEEPSDMCWPDKYCVAFDPWWLYLPRVILSGEIKEYRTLAAELGEVPLTAGHREWYRWTQERMIRKALNRDTTPPYAKVK